MLRLCLLLGAGLLCGPQDDAKKTIDDFKARIKEAKTPHEKALLVRALGDVEPRDAATAAAVARYLSPCPSDLACLLPVTAADALGKFRGCAAASRALVAAAPGYKKMPVVLGRIHAALGKVGHESALAYFEDVLHGTDTDAVVGAVQAIADFPAPLAVETFLREYEFMDKRKASAGDDAKKTYDRAQAEMLRALHRISGEKYPSLKEMAHWWQKRGPALKEEASKHEKTPIPPSTGPLPPVLLVELLFRENAGATTFNSGVSTAGAPTATIAGAKWTGQAALNGGPAALEWDKAGGPAAVDLASVEALKTLKSFTIAGWLLVTDGREATGGNRILSCLSPGKTPEGFELVWRADGSLQLGLNQPADVSTARSPSAQAPVLDPKAKDPTPAWRFFAVTYDAGVASAHAKFYLGGWQTDAVRVSTADCNRGPVGLKLATHLTVGNVPPPMRTVAPAAFRGILDEIRVFGSTADGSGALGLPEILKIQNRQGAMP